MGAADVDPDEVDAGAAVVGALGADVEGTDDLRLRAISRRPTRDEGGKEMMESNRSQGSGGKSQGGPDESGFKSKGAAAFRWWSGSSLRTHIFRIYHIKTD